MKADLFEPAFAIVRVDMDIPTIKPWGKEISIKCVVFEESAAKAEVERLNKLNADKGAIYFYAYTRVVKRS